MPKEKYQYRFSLIFLNYNRLDLAQQRVAEARRYLYGNEDAEIIWVDNGSDSLDCSRLFDKEGAEFENVRSLGITPNRGFGRGFNSAVELSQGEVVVLNSNDVEIKGDFLRMAGDSIYEFCIRGFLVCHKAHLNSTGWNQFGDTVFPYAEGYFLAMAKKFWDIIGGFDPIFHPYDYEDIDLSSEFRKIESIQVNPDARIKSMEMLPIAHAAASTIGYTKERFEHTVKMRALFAEKWHVPNEPERP